jgi:hypothetical protein
MTIKPLIIMKLSLQLIKYMNETFQVLSDSVIFCVVKYLGYTCYDVRIDLSFQKEDSFTST